MKIGVKKQTQEQKLTEVLKNKWMSSYQMQQELKSSSADRVMRRIRKNPPDGYTILQKRKDSPNGYGICLEYKLVKEEDSNISFMLKSKK